MVFIFKSLFLSLILSFIKKRVLPTKVKQPCRPVTRKTAQFLLFFEAGKVCIEGYVYPANTGYTIIVVSRNCRFSLTESSPGYCRRVVLGITYLDSVFYFGVWSLFIMFFHNFFCTYKLNTIHHFELIH